MSCPLRISSVSQNQRPVFRRMEGWALDGYRMRLGEAEYQFPDLCAILHEEANCSAAHNMTVGLQTISWPTLLYVS